MITASARGRHLARVALVAYSVALLVVLLNPSAAPASQSVTGLADLAAALGVPSALREPGRVEFVANVLIFVPVSLVGSMAWPGLTWRDWTAYGFAISFGVEAVQALALDARSATFVDVVANTLGTLVGAVLWAAAGWLRERR